MFDRAEIEHAVKLQRMSYRLLMWLEGAIEDGFIAPEAAHVHASMPEAALAWIEKHYLNLPADARPDRGDILPFSNLFSTFLESSFDLDAEPGERLYSPNAHCFCPMCSWMVRVPHLKPKKPTAAAKKRARMIFRDVLGTIAIESDVELSDDEAHRLVDAPEMREPLGLCAYAHDLLSRLEGRAIGPASLIIWRSFAWTRQGSPKKGFSLTAQAIMDAEEAVVERLRACQQGCSG